MKRLSTLLLLFALALPLAAQLYHAGERLDYRVSYRAKYFPNTEVGSVTVETTSVPTEAGSRYRVEGVARTLPTYRWFFNMEDRYTIWVDPATLRTERFESRIREGNYTFESDFCYDWPDSCVRTRWSSRKKPFQEKRLPLTAASMDAVSLFFNMRSASADEFTEGAEGHLDMLLEDTVRRISYRYLGREVKKIRNMGRFNALKFECQLGSSEQFSFTDGSMLPLWISDDENKIPLAIESPVRVGSVQAYLSGYKGLKYPLTSRIK